MWVDWVISKLVFPGLTYVAELLQAVSWEAQFSTWSHILHEAIPASLCAGLREVSESVKVDTASPFKTWLWKSPKVTSG